MRTVRDCFIFLLIVALVGFSLIGVGSVESPWTWVLTVIGATIVEKLSYLVYKSQPRKKPSE